MLVELCMCRAVGGNREGFEFLQHHHQDTQEQETPHKDTLVTHLYIVRKRFTAQQEENKMEIRVSATQ